MNRWCCLDLLFSSCHTFCMRLPKSLTRVTGFSKIIAFLLLLIFIGSAFYGGMLFQQKYAAVIATITPTPTPISNNQIACTTDSNCTLTTSNVQNSCCANTRCVRYADERIIAVNAIWLAQEKNAVCGVRRMCPMIAVICTRSITEENAHYSAKCVQNVCQKVQN